MSVALANPTVTVNNEAWKVVPNSVKFTEGLGEQNMRAASSGGANTEQVYSQNVENNFSKVTAQFFPDPEQIDKIRAVKVNNNNNLIVLTGNVTDKGVVKSLKRSFTNAAILTDYDVELGADTVIEIEFQSDPAS